MGNGNDESGESTVPLSQSKEIARSGQCVEHGQLMRTLSTIERTVKEIQRDLGDGRVTFATLDLRMGHLEKIVYGACGLALIAVASAILSLVLRR